MKKGNGKRLGASVTVEAAFIVPFILFITLAVTVMILMLYNRTKMTGDINFLLEYAREKAWKYGSADREELADCWNSLSARGYLFCNTAEPVIEIEGDEITIRASLEMNAPVGRLCERLVRSFGVSTAAGSISVTRREKAMRLIDAGMTLIDSIGAE